MKKNLTGKTFGLLTVIEIHSRTRNGHIRYVCSCSCGSSSNVLSTHLLQGNTISCGCTNIQKKGNESPYWKGYGEISKSFYNEIKRSADGGKGRRKPIDFNVSIEYLWDLFLKQNKKCSLSGQDLFFPKSNSDKSFNSSLDRIDSSKGYVIGNVQWVHKDINIMKNKYNQNYFIEICKLITKNNEIKI
jgi:hypothetical protein